MSHPEGLADFVANGQFVGQKSDADQLLAIRKPTFSVT